MFCCMILNNWKKRLDLYGAGDRQKNVLPAMQGLVVPGCSYSQGRLYEINPVQHLGLSTPGFDKAGSGTKHSIDNPCLKQTLTKGA